MQDSVRDAFGVTLKYLGYSLNSTDLDELTEARDLLIKQKPLVQAYVIDQVRDKMIGNEAAIGVIYSGEAIYTQMENPDLEYVIPEEGSNIWIDSWVIPKNAENKENAEKFINFLCRPEIALMNFEYITYSTPNSEARKLIEDEAIRNSEIAFPDLSKYDNLETFQYLGTEADQTYGELWNQVNHVDIRNLRDLLRFARQMQTATGSHIPNVSGGIFAEHFYLQDQFLLSLFRISFLDQIQDAVKPHCNDTQHKNRHQNSSKLKGLAGINNQIAKPLSGSDKFTDDDTYKTKTDINLHDAQDQRHGGGKDNFVSSSFCFLQGWQSAFVYQGLHPESLYKD